MFSEDRIRKDLNVSESCLAGIGVSPLLCSGIEYKKNDKIFDVNGASILCALFQEAFKEA